MISIIGAGPAGSYLAYLLAKKGEEVTLVEEHKEIGKPIQCTGIVTGSIENFVKLKKEVFANRLKRVVVVSRGKRIESAVDEVVMWRDKFDQFMAEKAQYAGAKLLLNTKFVSLDKKGVRVKDKTSNKVRVLRSSSIVGADGPYSSVAKMAGLTSQTKFYMGMQAKVRLRADTDAFETYFGSMFPNFFGWVVPESEDTVRLGLGAFENTKDYFYKFLQRRVGKKEILCWESGVIPVYNPQKVIQRGNIYLLGDAATQVKATTGGGIIPSLKAAQTLCDCILHNKDYSKEFKKKSGRELYLHLKIRALLNKFSDEDYNHLLGLMNQERVKRVIRDYDRDTPIPLVFNLLLKEPRFLFYLKYAF